MCNGGVGRTGINNARAIQHGVIDLGNLDISGTVFGGMETAPHLYRLHRGKLDAMQRYLRAVRDGSQAVADGHREHHPLGSRHDSAKERNNFGDAVLALPREEAARIFPVQLTLGE